MRHMTITQEDEISFLFYNRNTRSPYSHDESAYTCKDVYDAQCGKYKDLHGNKRSISQTKIFELDLSKNKLTLLKRLFLSIV